MATPPDFTTGSVLTAAQMNAVGLWRITSCTVTSVGGTAATASNGVITVGTGNTSVTVSSAFSSDFDNYRIVYNNGTNSANGELTLVFGSTNTGYYNTVVYGAWSNSPTALAAGSANSASFAFAGAADPDGNFLDLKVYNPNLARRTVIAGPFVGMDNDRVGGYTTGFLANTTTYTAFTIAASTGSMTGGTIRVYGYRN